LNTLPRRAFTAGAHQSESRRLLKKWRTVKKRRAKYGYFPLRGLGRFPSGAAISRSATLSTTSVKPQNRQRYGSMGYRTLL
jgi:hypothetical protein